LIGRIAGLCTLLLCYLLNSSPKLSHDGGWDLFFFGLNEPRFEFRY
jgi:hypothetical protein